MDYTTYLNAKESAKGIRCGALRITIKIAKWLITAIINLCRSVLYIISTVGVALFGFMLPFGAYFGYTVIRQMINGTTFFEAKNWGMFLFCFCVPFAFMIVRNITKPRK